VHPRHGSLYPLRNIGMNTGNSCVYDALWVAQVLLDRNCGNSWLVAWLKNRIPCKGFLKVFMAEGDQVDSNTTFKC
jgi:hypothetical protein